MCVIQHSFVTLAEIVISWWTNNIWSMLFIISSYSEPSGMHWKYISHNLVGWLLFWVLKCWFAIRIISSCAVIIVSWWTNNIFFLKCYVLSIYFSPPFFQSSCISLMVVANWQLCLRTMYCNTKNTRWNISRKYQNIHYQTWFLLLSPLLFQTLQ